MRYRRFDVLVTAFPFVDNKMMKKRPVVCIAFFRPAPSITLYWVLMITSTALRKWKGDIEIRDLKKAGLPIPSIIRTCKVACVDGSMIEKRIGTLATQTQEAIQKEIGEVFGDR